ncbi:MAG TPA: DUF4282 domain-containing protein [Caulobacteraceae bacterium]
MKSPRSATRPDRPNSVLWNLLTLENLMTGSLVHLVYWFGLGVIALGGFGAVGGAVGLALREGPLMGILAAIPVAVAGLLVISALAIVWRSFCEFYVIVIQIGEDLRVLRRSAEADMAAPRAVPAAALSETLPLVAPAPSAQRRRPVADRDQ